MARAKQKSLKTEITLFISLISVIATLVPTVILSVHHLEQLHTEFKRRTQATLEMAATDLAPPFPLQDPVQVKDRLCYLIGHEEVLAARVIVGQKNIAECRTPGQHLIPRHARSIAIPASLKQLTQSNPNNSLNQSGTLTLTISTEKYDAELDQLIRSALKITLIVIGCSIILAYLFAYSFIKPLTLMVETMRRVAEGDLNCRVDYESNNEVGALVESFDQMITTLKEDTKAREQAEKSLAEQAKFTRLEAKMATILTEAKTLPEMLQQSTELIRQHCNLALACFWLPGDDDKQQLRLFTTTDHRQADPMIPHQVATAQVGSGLIGQLAEKETVYVTNRKISDAINAHQQAWLQKLNIVSFIAMPLVIDHRLIGILSLFTYRVLSDIALNALTNIGARLASGVNRLQAEATLQENKERYRLLSIELKRSNEELESFARIASHDMKEPLRKIQSFSEILIEDYSEVLDEDGKYYLERVDNAATRMHRLIEDLLAYARITTQTHPVVRLELPEVIREVNNDLEILIKESQGKINIGPLLPVSADPAQLHQLLQNLLSNGLKYHRPGVPPDIDIRAETAGEHWVKITIQDQGIGFESQYADKIFGVFERLHGKGGQYSGSGIGLSICKKIVTRHGGQIQATGRPGQGATFTFTLPA